jgi:MoaA/NifB/PqqE/SkfB family radical SAM enzyme
MDKEVFVKLAENFKGKDVAFIGSGEPFMHPDIFAFFSICQDHNSNVNLTTNGSLLTKEISIRLLRYTNIKSIAFSIDGVNENYESIRINSKFLNVVNNLRTLSELRKGNSPEISINFVGMRSNIDDFPKLIEIVGQYIDSALLTHPIVYSPDESDQHLNRHIEYATEKISQAMVFAQKFKVKLTVRPLKPCADKCFIPWATPYIGVKGDVYPCCMIAINEPKNTATEYYDEVSIPRDLHGHSLGNIMDMEFSDVWNGINSQRFRRILKGVNSQYAGNYDEAFYLKLMRSWSTSDPYCKICQVRWNTAC